MNNASLLNPSARLRAAARPVSLITIVFLFVVFAAFLFAARYFYRPSNVDPQNAAAENYSKDLEWRATAQARRKTLNELNAHQASQLSGYVWVDQSAGVVRLPIDRAMELTVQKYGAKK